MDIGKELLERVGAQVLEDVAFVFATPIGEPVADRAAWNATGVRLVFEGPFRGFCELWAPAQTARLLASNMLGAVEDCQEADEMGSEALRETLNILSGNLLTELAGEDSVFELAAPMPCAVFETPFLHAAVVEAWFDVDRLPVLLRAGLLERQSRAA